MSTKPLLALLLSAVAGGCATPQHPASAEAADPGRLPWALESTRVPGLSPCNGTATAAVHLDVRLPVNILVHGHNGSPATLRGLARALASHGQQSVCFVYDERDSIMRSSGQLARAIDQLARQLQTPQITVIGHSVGGLIARKALVADRPDPVRSASVDLQLVTVSAPFAGVASAQACANRLLRTITFGLTDLACWLISGNHWQEITPSSDFIQRPGALAPQVRRHLLITTDERDRCADLSVRERCLRHDYVFSLHEQQLPGDAPAPRTTQVTVLAGHSEMISEAAGGPARLIDVFQDEGMVPPNDLLSQRGAEWPGP